MSRTKVAPLRRLSIPRLELCGAQVLARLLGHLKELFQIPSSNVYAWTDSTIVLNWLTGSPRRFKTYVGNRVSCIVDLVSPDRWGHVDGIQNPADCASRGLLPSTLLDHDLWWTGPRWLRWEETEWPKQPKLAPNSPAEEGEEVCHHTVIAQTDPALSSFSRLKRITAWLMRFTGNCQARKKNANRFTTPLTADELRRAENFWISFAQREHFASKIGSLKANVDVPLSSSLISLSPFLKECFELVVGKPILSAHMMNGTL